MKKSINENPDDQELQQFFQELKSEDAKEAVPDLESMLTTLPQKPNVIPIWRYAAVVALLIVCIGTYQWGFNEQELNADKMQIVISYDTPEPPTDESEDLAIPGIDQWQSETDILLSGL